MSSTNNKLTADMPFWTAFFNSIAMITVTELGDKTFFIAAVLAMRHPRIVVYLGAMAALAGMTVLSSIIGYALPQLLPKIYTHYASIVLFGFFGFKLLSEAYEGYQQKVPKKNEELEEVEKELGVSGEANTSSTTATTLENAKSVSDIEQGATSQADGRREGVITGIAVITQAFMLTFVAEWGDRSQIATIAMASVQDPFGVTVGGIIGHACCTGLAVLGGRFLATRISERQVALAGGILFWVFAIHSFVVGP